MLYKNGCTVFIVLPNTCVFGGGRLNGETFAASPTITGQNHHNNYRKESKSMIIKIHHQWFGRVRLLDFQLDTPNNAILCMQFTSIFRIYALCVCLIWKRTFFWYGVWTPLISPTNKQKVMKLMVFDSIYDYTLSLVLAVIFEDDGW